MTRSYVNYHRGMLDERFHGHHSYFRKYFQMLLAHKKGEIQFPHRALGHI